MWKNPVMALIDVRPHIYAKKISKITQYFSQNNWSAGD
jgi:hypothetical protein